MDQPELESNACNRRQARENACERHERGTIGESGANLVTNHRA